ncbi:MAG: leucine--tRNA ligase [Parcubacteria group bacterium]|nr:leucine--tRNA ligase [Parcubacteria group bacterium]
MQKYNHKIEKKWQKQWEKDGLYKTPDTAAKKENYYTLVEFPYPSGNLHIGHWYAFAVPDIFARYKRMQGHNVLFPIGFDAFGLPAENAAIKNKVDPKKWTYENISRMTEQLKSIGASFDWSRQVITSDPEYYKWTQWLFLQLYKKGLAYRGKAVVNWDPIDKTVLANEQVLPDGTAERSGAVVEKKELEQWFLKITDYAERLLKDLGELSWLEEIKQSQRAWIGKSEGALIKFQISSLKFQIEVFTTRPDTLFGATYLVLAPEHKIISDLRLQISNWNEVERYIKHALAKKDIDRIAEKGEKTGVELKGIKAINPANNEEIPIWVADYVLGGYGTGAIMAVPAHDERDFAFAKKNKLPVRTVVAQKPVTHVVAFLESKQRPGTFLFQQRDKGMPTNPGGIGLFGGAIEVGETIFLQSLARELEEELELKLGEQKIVSTCAFEANESDRHIWAAHIRDIDESSLRLHEGKAIVPLTLEEAIVHPRMNPRVKDAINAYLLGTRLFIGEGTMINSGKFDGMESEEAKEKITAFVKGKKETTYKLRDWLISRQRYWGCPIPIVYDPNGKAYPIPEEHLPWTLPTDVDFTPTGEPPLASSKELKKRTEKIFGKGWRSEYDTMDTFIDSSWYFLRYTDPKNDKEPASKKLLKQWMPVKRYSGGAEHTTMHLLYSRFFHKALFDLGIVTEKEPYLSRMNRGIILGTDGRKMSKRWGNVIDPDTQVKMVGADSVRLYLAFIGPYNTVGHYPWDTGGIAGTRRFLERVWKLQEKIAKTENDTLNPELETLTHQTIKKVGEDIENFKFNTAVSALMIFANALEKEPVILKTQYELLLCLLAPFAPHVTEELWKGLLHTSSIHTETWPPYDEKKMEKATMTIVVQVDGKVRDEFTISKETTEEEIKKKAQVLDKVLRWVEGKDIQKILYVQGKLVSIVTKRKHE